MRSHRRELVRMCRSGYRYLGTPGDVERASPMYLASDLRPEQKRPWAGGRVKCVPRSSRRCLPRVRQAGVPLGVSVVSLL